MLRSAEVLVNRILSDENLLAQIKENPQVLSRLAREVIGELPPFPREIPPNPWIYYLVVCSLGITVIMVVGGAIYLSCLCREVREIPAVLTAIGSAAVGALSGLLAPSPRQ